MDPIRVLIIDDSAFMRKMITNILESDYRIQVLGTARNGVDGLKKINKLTPDVVTLDIEMPVMDGITTLDKIINTNPLPVVMLSSKTNSKKVIQAMSKGAVDFIAKPSGSISLNIKDIKDEIIEKVMIASQSKFQTPIQTNQNVIHHMNIPEYEDTLIIIGSSTGGPRALQQIVSKLPSDFPASILIVQHMPPKFTKTLAERLDLLSAIQVKEATDGEIIEKGIAYIAPGGFHMKVVDKETSFSIDLTKEPENSIYRPSVDVTLRSIAVLNNAQKVVVILTGMGRDGAQGIKEIKQKDSQTIVLAESVKSAVIYGMPAAAVKTGYVQEKVHLNQMSEAIKSIVMGPGRG